MSKKELRKQQIAQTQAKEQQIRTLYGIAVGFATLASAISFAGIIYWTVNNVEYDLFTAILYTVTFFALIGGILAHARKLPPFHHLIHVGALILLITSLILTINGSNFGLLLGIDAFLILYVAIRFPTRFELEQSKLRR